MFSMMDDTFPINDVRLQLSEYVEKLTTSGRPELEPSILKPLKNLCRANDDNLKHVFHVIMYQLEQDHSEIRLNAFLLLDELFRRSHVFREAVLADFQVLLEQTVETDPELPLPPPKTAANKLKCKALECIQQWHSKFGSTYKQLMLGYRFLKDCKKVDFENIEARSVVEQQRIEQEARRREALLQKKVDTVLQEMKQKIVEIENVKTEIENGYSILFETIDNIFTIDDFKGASANPLKQVTYNDNGDSDVSKETENGLVAQNMTEREDSLREHGLQNYRYNIEFELKKKKFFTINEDNAPIVNSVRELVVVITTKLLPSVEKWIQVLIKSEKSKNELLKCINIKQALNAALDKYRQLNINDVPLEIKINEDAESDDDDFEEVAEKEGFEKEVNVHSILKETSSSSSSSSGYPSLSPLLAFPIQKDIAATFNDEDDPTSLACNIKALKSKFIESCGNPKDDEAKPSSSTPGTSASTSIMNERKTRLLSKAPKLRYDVDLFKWDEKLTAPSVVSFDSLHRFWLPRENETKETETKDEASLRMRKIEFTGKFTPVKWQCRAPLKNGKLCPRFDRVKCPFHGNVIARDDQGNPTDPRDIARLKEEEELKKKDKPPDWQDPELLREIEASTGIDLTVGKKKKAKKKRYPGLTDLKAANNNTRKRLEKIILDKSAVKRISSTMDNLDYKRHRDKFGDQWNYAYHT